MGIITFPLVAKNNVFIGGLGKKCIYEEYNNGHLKYHRLSASDANYFYLLTSDRSLVRYLWTDIEAGIFDKDTTVKTNVEDFTVAKDRTLILCKDGMLAVVRQLGCRDVPILTENSKGFRRKAEVQKWTCIQASKKFLLVTASLQDDRGLVVALGRSLTSVKSSVELATTANQWEGNLE